MMTSDQSQTCVHSLLQPQDSATVVCNANEDESRLQDEQAIFTSLRFDDHGAISHPSNTEEGRADIMESMALVLGTNSLVGTCVGVFELTAANNNGADLYVSEFLAHLRQP